MGSEIIDLPALRTGKAREEAAQWLERLDSGGLSKAERDALDEWLAAAATNRQAFEQVKQLAGLTAALRSRSGDVSLARPHAWERWTFSHLGAVAVGVAACLLAVVAVTLFQGSLFQGSRGTPEQQHHYATAVGAQEVIALPDGSSMHLNTATRVAVLYTEGERRVRLEHGEAHFDVRKDPRRPFIVVAGNRSVEAVGTAFTVSMLSEQVEVTVAEGKVNVHGEQMRNKRANLEDARPLLASLRESERVLIRPGKREITVLSASELARELAWREGMLVFAGEALTEVLAEVSRYSDATFLIEDPALRELRFGGLFRVGKTQALLEALHTGYGIEARRDTQQRIILSRSRPTGPQRGTDG